MIYTQNIKRFFISIFSVFLLGLLITSTSHAKDDLSYPEEVKNQVKVIVTNDQTGETFFLNPVDTKELIDINSFKLDNGSIDVGYDVFVPIEKLNSSGIVPFDDSGGSTNSGGVTARLNVNYDLISNDQIRVNRLWGSWTLSHSMYFMSNRSANVHSGVVVGKVLNKIPTSDSFTYTTGWGYNPRVYSDAAPRAWSSAKVNVAGMDATYTITLEFTFPS